MGEDCAPTTNNKLETRQRSTEAEQIVLYLVRPHKERTNEKRSEEKSRKETSKKKTHICILKARTTDVHHVSKFCVARKRALVHHRRKHDAAERERHKNSISEKKARQKDSNTCKPKQSQSRFFSRSFFFAECSYDAYMCHAEVAYMRTCRRTGPQTWRHSDMEAHIHTCMRTYTAHITIKSSRLASRLPCRIMADAQSHVPWERSAKWVAKFVQGNIEAKMRTIWK